MKTILLNTPYHLSLLAQLGHPQTRQPELSRLLEALYSSLFVQVISEELAQETVTAKMRMGVWRGRVIRKKQKVVVADVIRGGMEPSALFYHKLTEILDPRFVRQDHIMSQRVETGGPVTEAALMGSKIGGSIRGNIVFIPDPMGATGHSMKEVIGYYLKHFGRPKRFVVVNAVVTPTHLKRLKTLKAPLHVYAARLDPKLNHQSFIVPGLGGLGEVINNTLR